MAMAGYTSGDFKRKYIDVGDEHGMSLKRQQLLGPADPYFGHSSGSDLMYSASYAYDGHCQPPPFPVIRARGLPFDCMISDVVDFFCGVDILDVLFVNKGVRFTGEAFCVLAYPSQVDLAIQRNMRNMGRRYIEVFRSKRQEYYSAVAHEVSNSRGTSSSQGGGGGGKSRSDGARKKNNSSVEHTGILRMRGLPYSAVKDDIINFFERYQLSENNVCIVLNSDGRPSGEAFVEFASADDSRLAMDDKDGETIGSRYIELFPSTTIEMERASLRAQ